VYVSRVNPIGVAAAGGFFFNAVTAAAAFGGCPSWAVPFVAVVVGGGMV
jgi:hypothetical protein